MKRRRNLKASNNQVILPPLHAMQLAIIELANKYRWLAVCCGRRFGKTYLLANIASDYMVHGFSVGVFSNGFKLSSELFKAIADIVGGVAGVRIKTIEREIELTSTGGSCTFFTTDNPTAGRSRRFDIALLDEIGFAKDNMSQLFQNSITPTLLDYSATPNGNRVIACSTPNGNDPGNFFYQICHDTTGQWGFFHAPTSANPMIEGMKEFLAARKAAMPDKGYRQEYEAEFVSWAGDAFFSVFDCIPKDQEEPKGYAEATPQARKTAACIFATLDTAQKAEEASDGSAWALWAYEPDNQLSPDQPELTLIDWDLVKVEGALLDYQLDKWLKRADEIVKNRYNIRNEGRYEYRDLNGQYQEITGFVGAFIEDKASGIVLLQQAQARGMPCFPINNTLTRIGKENRAIAAATHIYQRKVGISEDAMAKTVIYNSEDRNHFMSQVFGFTRGGKVKNDDALDAFCYGVLIALEHSGTLGS